MKPTGWYVIVHDMRTEYVLLSVDNVHILSTHARPTMYSTFYTQYEYIVRTRKADTDIRGESERRLRKHELFIFSFSRLVYDRQNSIVGVCGTGTNCSTLQTVV